MQILNIILYGEQGKRRILSFDIGKVNIITGDSKTGKTAIIDIVDYCLGGSDFKVAEGIVRKYVEWYAIRLQLKSGQLFIARPNPSKKYSKSAVLLLQGDNILIPHFNDLKANTTKQTLLSKLSNIIGIGEYKHKAEGNSRPATPATFKHSRFYCFQPQTDIDQRDFLFYNQNKEGWVAQAMKDTLPYFLGAISNKSVVLKKQLSIKKRDLNRLKREIKDAQSIIDRTLGKTFVLLTEAQQVGLIPFNTHAKDREEALEILKSLSLKDDISEKQELGNEILIEFQDRLQQLKSKRSEITENIKGTKIYQKETEGYEDESNHQISRLESINLFPKNMGVDNSICPLCSHPLQNPIPSINNINKALLGLKSNLKITKKEQPKLKEYLDKLETQKRNISIEIKSFEEKIDAIYKQQNEARKLKDLNIRKGKVLGRISLYLESKIEVDDFSETNRKIEDLKWAIDDLKSQIGVEDKEKRLEEIIDQLNFNMTKWSKDLELEFKDRMIRFDVKRLTIFIVSSEKTIRFDQTGSGENWVAYHLLIHFALHKHFVLKNRPVPNFLILDQLSQAYFPPEKDIKGTGEIEQSEDDKAIKRLFDFIFERTGELEGKFQTIIIDHAKLNDSKFHNAITEEWRNGIKLVPIDWISNN